MSRKQQAPSKPRHGALMEWFTTWLDPRWCTVTHGPSAPLPPSIWGCRWERKLKLTEKSEAVRGPVPAAVTAPGGGAGEGPSWRYWWWKLPVSNAARSYGTCLLPHRAYFQGWGGLRNGKGETTRPLEKGSGCCNQCEALACVTLGIWGWLGCADLRLGLGSSPPRFLSLTPLTAEMAAGGSARLTGGRAACCVAETPLTLG